jgi:hypothetical protein
MRGSDLRISLAMAAGFGLAALWYKIKSQDGVQEKQVQEATYLPPNASTLLRRVLSSWSRLRRARRSRKICGLASGAFRGGDFVVTTDGLAPPAASVSRWGQRRTVSQSVTLHLLSGIPFTPSWVKALW